MCVFLNLVEFLTLTSSINHWKQEYIPDFPSGMIYARCTQKINWFYDLLGLSTFDFESLWSCALSAAQQLHYTSKRLNVYKSTENNSATKHMFSFECHKQNSRKKRAGVFMKLTPSGRGAEIELISTHCDMHRVASHHITSHAREEVVYFVKYYRWVVCVICAWVLASAFLTLCEDE